MKLIQTILTHSFWGKYSSNDITASTRWIKVSALPFIKNNCESEGNNLNKKTLFNNEWE